MDLMSAHLLIHEQEEYGFGANRLLSAILVSLSSIHKETMQLIDQIMIISYFRF